ncbi:MAG: L,D-transpeptidase family protein [Gemmatimonas sp.]
MRHLLTLTLWLVLLIAPALAAGTKTSVALPAPAAAPVDRIVVFKSAREMQLLRDGWIVKSYRIALGSRPEGHKRWEYDGRTPEGLYTISGRNPRSHYYLALLISYPDEKDRAEAARLGVTPGGDIEIHGMPNPPHRPVTGDWTDGCIAVSNAAMREIWTLVRDGTPIEILP